MKKILVVDDDELCRIQLEATLSANGYEVVTARNGVEACEILAESDIRLVITDWMMPVMDGIELCHKIRAEHHDPYVYIAMLTSQSENIASGKGLDAGADAFISKPFEATCLVAQLKAGERIISLNTHDASMCKLIE